MSLNLAQQMLAQGTAVLAKQSPQSEAVIFDGETVQANVNRTPAPDTMPGPFDAATEETSSIEYPLTASTPSSGDTLTDSFGHTHRVKTVRHIGHAYRLECEVLR